MNNVRRPSSENILDEHFNPTIEVPHQNNRLSTRLTAKKGNGGGWLVGKGSKFDLQDAPPFELAVLAGGCASAVVDIIIFPLDSIKTRLQAPQGFAAAGGYRGLFSGVLAAGLGAVPGGAIFFGSYEYSRAALQPRFSDQPQWTLDAMAASCAATASCLVRTPAIVVQQRMQVGQYSSLPAAVRGIAAEGGVHAFYSGLTISIAREIPFAFIQFPIYEGLKRMWASGTNDDALSPTRVALCGAVAGAVAAAATTPLDLLKTRQMLGGASGLAGLTSEARLIVAQDGVSGLFMGVGPRVGWMAMGGYIFFGVYELCMGVLGAMYYPQPAGNTKLSAAGPPGTSAVEASSQLAPPTAPPPDAVASPAHTGHSLYPADGSAVSPLDARPVATAEAVPTPPLVALLAGGLSGMVIDMALYPIDTYKTRTIQGLSTPLSGGGVAGAQATPLLGRLAELRTLWQGIGVALLPAIPAASVFFVTYEGFPLFEELKSRLTQWRGGRPASVDGALAGSLAGAVAAFCTTPLDVVRTRHVLWDGERGPLTRTVARIFAQDGLAGFWRGVAPRTAYMAMGGALYLGTYSYCTDVLSRIRFLGAPSNDEFTKAPNHK